MKGFPGVTDNECFAFLSQQPETGEENFLPQTVRHNNGWWRFGYLIETTALPKPVIRELYAR